MCGRFTSTTPPTALADLFDVTDVALDDDLQPRWNVAPTLPVLAVAESRSTGARRLGTFRWGLVPSWAPDLSVGSRMINARAETVATKPAYAESLRRRRCIIPADAFYEWRVGEGKVRQPYAIAHKDRTPLAFAGLWAAWRDPAAPAGSPPVRSCTIITTTANSRLEELHERMPVVLPADVWDEWLDPANLDVPGLTELLTPAPPEDFTFWPVAPLVNKPVNDGPELLEPVDADALAAAFRGGHGRPSPPSVSEPNLFGPLLDH